MKNIRWRIENIQITLEQEYKEEPWTPEENWFHPDSSEMPRAKAGRKNSQELKKYIFIFIYIWWEGVKQEEYIFSL